MGREDALVAIEEVLGRFEGGPVAITALHGLRGVGKTVLAAAYAELHRGDYRATWWVPGRDRAVDAGGSIGGARRSPRLGRRRRQGGAGARRGHGAAAARGRRYSADLRQCDRCRCAETLSAAWRRGAGADYLECAQLARRRRAGRIRLWPKKIGADFLIARTGRTTERDAAEDLAEALGGLPLAHEQAASYCERIEIPLAEYRRRFAATPAEMLDAARDAPAEYHDKLTVAKTFALAIEEAAKLHPAAGPLLVHAALLAPEPIPLFLFAEAREKFGEPLASALAGHGLDEGVAALRAFALVDRGNRR